MREAIESVKWNPAVVDDRPISVSVSFPVLFLLTDNRQQTYERIKKGWTPTFKTPAFTIIQETGYVEY